MSEKFRVKVTDRNLVHSQKLLKADPQADISFESPVIVIYPLLAQEPQSVLIAKQKTVNIEMKTLLLVVDPENHLQWIDSLNAEYLQGESLD